MRNQWDERGVSEAKAEAVAKTNHNQWAYESDKGLKSEIDTINAKGKVKDFPKIIEKHDEFEKVPKKDHFIHNIFLQSHIQDKMEEQMKKDKAPWSHDSFNKNGKPKNYMVEGRPLFDGQGSHVKNVNAGRARTFYSSNVF